MEREKTTKIGPVCRFGPGGDYISTWPTDWADLARQMKGPVARLSNVLNGIIDALRGTEDELIIDEQTANASEQAMLFADDWKILKPAERKTTHRIRAFHKTRNFNSSKQPTLFDEHFKGAKTA
jgi:hypothetical protein